MRPPIPFVEVQRAMQSGLPSVALATIVLAAGLAASVLSRLRSRNPLLRWFGIFALLYGLRLFLVNDLMDTAIGISGQSLGVAVSVITYSIPVPYALFLRELFGDGWKKLILMWLGAEGG